MRLSVQVLFSAMLLFNYKFSANPEKKKNLFSVCLAEQEDNFVVNLLRQEDKKIGRKVYYACCASGSFKEIAQNFFNGKVTESQVSWQNFQKYCNQIKQAPTPYSQQVFYGGIGFWLYSRMAYPVGKKNWGVVKRTAAKTAIFGWLLKDLLLQGCDVDKNKMSMTQVESLEKKRIV